MTDLTPPGKSTGERAFEWPEYLSEYEALVQHFRAQLEGLSTSEKGKRFARMVQRLTPQTEFGSEYENPALSQAQSHDEGVDLTANAKQGSGVLYVQSKLWIDRAEDLDSILSKFEAFQDKYHSDGGAAQSHLRFDEPVGDSPVRFLIVTASRLDGVKKRYKDKQYSSRRFYDLLIDSGRIETVDGLEIFSLLRGAYLKLGEIPRQMTVKLADQPLHRENVYLGIISSEQLKQLYQGFGDALFFENVRDFIDPAKSRVQAGRTTPNLEIIRTVQNEPSALLARNNGIVFRAEQITLQTDLELSLTRGSIVNGCQTTMCIVQHATCECFVPVKLVESGNAWDVAKAANYQNAVNDIDLELARHLRPQIVKRAANIAGAKIEDGKESAFQIVDALYAQRVAYQETRLLYIGLFSRQPNNLYSSNYTEINRDLVSRFYQEDQYGTSVFEMLFSLQSACREALEAALQAFGSSAYSSLFDRYYKDDSPTYRCYVGILAACGAVQINIADRSPEPSLEFERVGNFIRLCADLLANNVTRFSKYYILALKIWMTSMMDAGNDEGEIRQFMNLQSRRADFSNMYKKICMEADLSKAIAER